MAAAMARQVSPAATGCTRTRSASPKTLPRPAQQTGKGRGASASARGKRIPAMGAGPFVGPSVQRKRPKCVVWEAAAVTAERARRGGDTQCPAGYSYEVILASG